ncbi:MAG: FtsX-like permease family protein [Gammaproteobacteria bacterium]|nr:FtsX-like permease family protein [Gammaproteobacteria bacterium]
MLLKILLRNAARHRLRTVLTVAGTAVAILAFVLLQTVVDAWYSGVAASSANRLVTRNAISLLFPLPIHYRDRIRQVDGVASVSYGSWFGGYYQDPKNFFVNLAMEPASYLALYPEYRLSEEERAAFLRDRRGAIVGRKLSERFGWKVGDTVPLKGTVFPGDWPVTVRGVYRGRDRNTDETLLLFHWEYLNETLRKTDPGRVDQVGIYVIGLARPEGAAAASVAIDSLFASSAAETLTESEQAFLLGFVAMSETILVATRVVALVVIATLLAVVGNTMAMSVRERLSEYAVLKTLGFGAGRIALSILGESVLITLVGGVLGLALAFPVTGRFAAMVGGLFPNFAVEPRTVLEALGTAVLVGLAAAALPARQAVRVGIAEALGRVG